MLSISSHMVGQFLWVWQSMAIDAERAGLLTLPPLDVDRVRWYNPATLTPGGFMWYAVNPSFDFAHSFWAWCAARGPTQMQVPLWRAPLARAAAEPQLPHSAAEG
jgi:hypothetical protein